VPLPPAAAAGPFAAVLLLASSANRSISGVKPSRAVFPLHLEVRAPLSRQRG
jgi:hypothetical protein